MIPPSIKADVFGMAHTPEESARNRARRPADVMEVDTTAQGVVAGTLGAGAGGVLRPLLARALPGAPAVVSAATGAGEGAVASNAQGGDATTGAILGAIPGAAGALGGVAKRTLGGLAEGAEARGVARAATAIEERTTKRTKQGLQKDSVEDLIREDKTVRKAAGNDTKLGSAVDKVKTKAAADLDGIYKSAPPEVDLAVPVMNMDRRITELKAGNVEQRAIAKHLEAIRDEFNDSLGARESVAPRALRDEQSAYQRAGYAKNPAGDPDVSARIAAHREASKAVGDAVLEHVTGLDHAGATAAAAENPGGLAARLLKANDRYSAASRIEAAIEDRASRGKAQHGAISKAIEFGKHVGHSPLGAALSLAPAAGKAALRGVDAALEAGAGAAGEVAGAAGGAAGRLAPIIPIAAPLSTRGAAPDRVLEQLVARADSGDADANAKLAAVSQAPIVAARVSAIRRKLGTP